MLEIYLISIILIVLLLIVLYCSYKIKKLSYDIYILSNECQTKFETKLFNLLMDYCKSINLKVYTEGEKDISPTAAGQIFYYTVGGTYKPSPNEYIVLSKKRYDSPWVLAHEIGHHIQLNKELISDEDGADYYADQICRQLLSKEDQYILRFGLECLYGKGIENYLQKPKMKS